MSVPDFRVKGMSEIQRNMFLILPSELTAKPLIMAKCVPFDMLLSQSEWGKRWSEMFSGASNVGDISKAIDGVCDFSSPDAVTISDRIAALAKISKPNKGQKGGGEEPHGDGDNEKEEPTGYLVDFLQNPEPKYRLPNICFQFVDHLITDHCWWPVQTSYVAVANMCLEYLKT